MSGKSTPPPQPIIDLTTQLIRSAQENAGAPRLPEGARPVLIEWLERCIVRHDALNAHLKMLERLQGNAYKRSDPAARPSLAETRTVEYEGLQGTDDSRLAFMALSPMLLSFLSAALWGTGGSRPWQRRFFGDGRRLLETFGLTVGMLVGDEPLPAHFPHPAPAVLPPTVSALPPIAVPCQD